MFSSIFPLSFLLSLVLAHPSPELARIQKHSLCDTEGAAIQIDKTYGNKQRPLVNKLSSGNCTPLTLKGNCQAFCEVRTTFRYGQEESFGGTYCQGPLTCSISDRRKPAIDFRGLVADQYSDALQAGVSDGLNFRAASGKASSLSVNLGKNQCGYYTFVPIRKESWLVLPLPHVVSTLHKVENAINICSLQNQRTEDGNVDGVTLFVKTDCKTRVPLARKEQDPIYQAPGVALLNKKPDRKI